MFPWNFNRHLDSLHNKCKVCQQYLVNEEMLLDDMDLEHLITALFLQQVNDGHAVHCL